MPCQTAVDVLWTSTPQANHVLALKLKPKIGVQDHVDARRTLTLPDAGD